MQKLLPPGPAHVTCTERGIVTARVFVENVGDRKQIHRWLLLGEPTLFRPPPKHAIRYVPTTEGEWFLEDEQAFLNQVRQSWAAGCRFIKAYFESHSIEQFPELPPDPHASPGFPRGTSRLLDAIGGVTSSADLAPGCPAQYDFGTILCLSPCAKATWVYRLGPEASNPSYEYAILSSEMKFDGGAIEMKGADVSRNYASPAAFAQAMMAEGVWGNEANTFALGTCFLVEDVAFID